MTSVNKKQKTTNTPPAEYGFKSDLNYFREQVIDSTIRSTQTLSIPNSYSLDNETLEFNLPRSEFLYTSLKESTLTLRVKALLKNGNVIPAGTDFSCVNLLLHSLFKSCEITTNGKVLPSHGIDNYGLSAYLQVELGFGETRKSEELSSALYYFDELPGTIDTASGGYLARKNFLKESQEVELCHGLYCSFMKCGNWIVPNVEINIKLKRNSDDFIFVVPTTNPALESSPYTLKIVHARFNITRHELVQSLSSKLEIALKSQPAFLSTKLPNLKLFNIAASTYFSVSEAVFIGPLPELIVVGITTVSSLLGSIHEAPYVFKNHDVTSIKVTVESEDGIQDHVIEVDEAKGLTLDAWRSLQNLTTSLDYGNGIKRTNYKHKFLYAFATLPRTLASSAQIKKSGSVRVTIKFSKAVERPLSLVVLGIHDALYRINELKEIDMVD